MFDNVTVSQRNDSSIFLHSIKQCENLLNETKSLPLLPMLSDDVSSNKQLIRIGLLSSPSFLLCLPTQD